MAGRLTLYQDIYTLHGELCQAHSSEAEYGSPDVVEALEMIISRLEDSMGVHQDA